MAGSKKRGIFDQNIAKKCLTVQEIAFIIGAVEEYPAQYMVFLPFRFTCLADRYAANIKRPQGTLAEIWAQTVEGRLGTFSLLPER